MDDSLKIVDTYSMALEAIGATLMAIGAWISITLGPIPFTLQTMAILAVLMTINGKRGTISIICYLLLGAVGIPVFAGFKGGPAALLGPTGGFLVGFILLGVVYYFLNDVLLKKFTEKRTGRIAVKLGSAIVGEVVMYVFGIIWFMLVYAKKTGPIGLGMAMSWCVTPFIIPDLIKMVCAVAVSEAARLVIKK